MNEYQFTCPACGSHQDPVAFSTNIFETRSVFWIKGETYPTECDDYELCYDDSTRNYHCSACWEELAGSIEDLCPFYSQTNTIAPAQQITLKELV